MSSSPLAVFLSLLLYFSLSTSGQHFYRNSLDPPRPSVSSPPAAKIQLACKATRFPDSCVDSITRSGKVGPDTDSVKIIRTAVSISFENLKKAQSMVKTIMDSSAGNTTRLVAVYSCIQSLGYSDYRIVSTDNALTRGRIKDARAWMSAALANQDGCVSGLKKINDTKQVGETMSFLKSLMGFSTNALGMMASYDNFGNDVRLWIPPATERDGFWEKAGTGGGGRTLAFPSGLTANVTVCKAEGEGCNYKKVQDAVNAAPDNDRTRRFVIRIKEGVYEETVRVPFEKKNVVFVGDGMGKTVITGSANVGQPGLTTYNSSTVGVLGDGFMARDITIQNTAGPNAHQAVAFRSDSDMSIVENCEFLGHQDTLYPHSLRQFYKSCRITGNVDFIFGNAAAFFQDCKILINPRQVTPEKGENNAVTAQGRTDPSQTTGFVFSNCTINGTEEYMRLFRSKPEVHKNFLGRPWKEFSRTVFIGCNFEALISPGGWMPWNGEFALKTLFYGEYKNAGPGSDTSRRVPWSSQISPEHSDVYSVEYFIQASGWTKALTS